MQFSNQSNITFEVTSCGRFDLLKRTLETFDLFNAADIRLAIPEHWRSHCKFLINRPKRGQLASIDLAYESVNTPIYAIAKTMQGSRVRRGFPGGTRS